jgi:hypothetical protein
VQKCLKAKFIVDLTQLCLREVCIGIALLIRPTIEPYTLTWLGMQVVIILLVLRYVMQLIIQTK